MQNIANNQCLIKNHSNLNDLPTDILRICSQKSVESLIKNLSLWKSIPLSWILRMAELTFVAEVAEMFPPLPPHVVFVYSRLWYFLEKKFSRTESCAEDINSFWISSILFWLQSYKIFCRCASVNRQSRTSTAETNCTTYYALFCLFCTTKCAFLTHACKKKIAHSKREWAIWIYGTLCSKGDKVAVMHAARE